MRLRLETWILILAFSYALEFNFSLRVCSFWTKKIPAIAARCIPIKLFTSHSERNPKNTQEFASFPLGHQLVGEQHALWLYPRGPQRPVELLLHDHSIACCLSLVHEWTATQKNGWLAVREYMQRIHTYTHCTHLFSHQGGGSGCQNSKDQCVGKRL